MDKIHSVTTVIVNSRYACFDRDSILIYSLLCFLIVVSNLTPRGAKLRTRHRAWGESGKNGGESRISSQNAS